MEKLQSLDGTMWGNLYLKDAITAMDGEMNLLLRSDHGLGEWGKERNSRGLQASSSLQLLDLRIDLGFIVEVPPFRVLVAKTIDYRDPQVYFG